MDRKRIVIMGAAGRDFHDFNVVYRDDPAVEVVAFTATQIPGIADRRYPPELAGSLYEAGIPIVPEEELERIIRDEQVDAVVFAYSDVSHETVMHAASRALAAGADFTLLGPARTMIESTRPVLAVGATRTGRRQEPDDALPRRAAGRARADPGRHPPPDAVRRPRRPARRALRDLRGPRPVRDHDRGARGVRAAPRRRPGRLRRRRLRGDPAPGRARRPTSSCGTAATTTSRSTGRTSTSSSPIRCARATSATTTRARRTSGWPTS